MTDLYFVDTNVLFYARDTTEPRKHQAAREWLRHLWSNRTGRISTQVLKEYYQVVTRRLQPGMPTEEAREDIRGLQTWNPVEINATTLEMAWVVEDRHGFSWWDSLIIASAQQANCRYLLSEDLQDGQTIGELSVINPFKNTINEV
ncbi:MAG: PIN domain-containing protein [Wenzhouxiangella sp.]